MFIPTDSQIKLFLGTDKWNSSIKWFLPQYEINTPQRVSCFMGQCSHESANFTVTKENLNYSAEGLMKVWPSRFPTLDIAKQYARNPEKIANKVYANRMGNGNENSGDGYKYIGRGLIQLTGKSNYSKFAVDINTPLEKIPEYLETLEGAVHSACWFWKTNNLNVYSDSLNIKLLTQKINGGTIGLEHRTKEITKAMGIFQ